MDIATLGGLLGAFGLIIWSAGGRWGAGRLYKYSRARYCTWWFHNGRPT